MSARNITPVACRISREEYDSITDCVNWSTLREAVKSGLAYQHRLNNPSEETDAMRLGRATHTAVFEPDRLLHEYVMWSGGTRRGNEWDAFKAMHAGRTILKPDEYDTAAAIRDAVHSHKVAKRLLQRGQAECTLRWVDKQSGLACKSRLDWLTARSLVDLKTTRNIEARAFGRHAAEMLYHCQLAFAVMGLASHGRKVKTRIIAVEQELPHDVAVYELNEDILWAGEVRVRDALELVAACRTRKRWPGRYPDEQPLALPSWEYPADDIELELTEAGIGGRR